MQESVRRFYLESMGIHVWRLRNTSGALPEETAAIAPHQVETVSTESPPTTTELQKLSVSEFETWLEAQCLLKIRAADTSANTLGDPNADLLVLSQCLIQDKLTHQPFTGKSGILLRNMLASIERDATSVMIGELDTPHADGKLLKEHVAGKNVKVVLLMVDLPDRQHHEELNRFRQRTFILSGTSVKVLVSYHPEYLCKSPQAKAAAWQDLLFTQKTLEAE